MDPALTTLLATLVGGAIGLISSYINNQHQLQLDKQQAEQKAQLELQQSLRTQLTSTYTNCASSLARLFIYLRSGSSYPPDKPEEQAQLNALVTEAYTQLQQLLIYAPPNISTDTYNKLQRAITNGQTPFFLEYDDISIITLQQITQTLAKLDSRLGLTQANTYTTRSLENHLNNLLKSLPSALTK